MISSQISAKVENSDSEARALNRSDGGARIESNLINVRNSPGATIIIDNRGSVQYVSPTIIHVLGYSSQEFATLNLFDLTHPAELGPLQKDLALLGEQANKNLLIQTQMRHKNGECHRIEGVVEKFLAGGTIGLLAITLYNLTHLGKTELNQRSMQMLQSLGMLAGNVAHDVGNMLTAVSVQASLIMEQTSADHPTRGNLAHIIKTSEQAGDLLDQIMAYLGKRPIQPVPVNINKLIGDNKALLDLLFPKSISLEADLAANLPRVEMSVGQAQQLVMNLIINAAQVYEGQPGKVRVRTAVTHLSAYQENLFGQRLPPGAYVQFSVADEGQGMDAQMIGQIFTPFFTTKPDGHGLGLATVRSIVRKYQGDIRVTSQAGYGTTFTVLLPVTNHEPAPVPINKPAPEPRSGTILLIEDEPVVREAVEELLTLKGFTVFSADSGYVGLQLFQRHQEQIDLLLLDLTMPGMSGQETLRHIRTLKPDLPAVLVSGYTNQMNGFQLPRTTFLKKPFAIDELMNKLHQLLGPTPA